MYAGTLVTGAGMGSSDDAATSDEEGIAGSEHHAKEKLN
jgi:hypothetical protein